MPTSSGFTPKTLANSWPIFSALPAVSPSGSHAMASCVNGNAGVAIVFSWLLWEWRGHYNRATSGGQARGLRVIPPRPPFWEALG
jgi:hypothetical protein